jgi:hypothetical protein
MLASIRQHAHVGCRGRALAAFREALSGCGNNINDVHMTAEYSTAPDAVTKRTNLCSAINDALHIVMENDPR